MALSPFAYASDGSRIVTAEGPALLVYDGEDESPRWERTLEADVAFVAFAGGEVVAVEANGRVTRFDAGGEERVAVELDLEPIAFAASDRGDLAIASDDAITVLPREGERRTIAGGAVALAWSAGGKALAIARPNRAFEVAFGDEEPQGEVVTSNPAHAIAWRPTKKGEWLVATARGVARIDRDAKEIAWLAALDVESGAIACSSEGALVAVRVGPTSVALLEGERGEGLGTLEYIDRVVGGVAFGPRPWLGVGLDLGDANKIDLLSGAARRTDPHEGRPRNRWLLLPRLDADAITAHLARASSDAPVDDDRDDASRVPLFLAAAAVVLVIAFSLAAR